MFVDEDRKLTVLSLMGQCLLAVQLAEKVLANAVGTVLDHPDLRLREQSEFEVGRIVPMHARKPTNRFPRLRRTGPPLVPTNSDPTQTRCWSE
jgi:hypothetical protein